MGWERGGRFKREGIYVYPWLIHVEIWQKTTKFCKAIILQLRKKKMKFIFSPLGSGLFWCFSSSKSRSRGFAHFFSFSKNAVTIIWMSWTSLLKDKSPPRGAELSSPRWGHSRSAPNQSIARYVSTCSIAEDRCLPEPCWNTSQLIDLWAKIKNAVACCDWILLFVLLQICFDTPILLPLIQKNDR